MLLASEPGVGVVDELPVTAFNLSVEKSLIDSVSPGEIPKGTREDSEKRIR